MRVATRVVLAPGEPGPPAGSPVRVELRDTSTADGPSLLVAVTEGVLEDSDEGLVATAVLDVDEDAFSPQADLTLWARSGGGGGRRTAVGDWITMASHPVRRADAESAEPIEVTLHPVR